MAYQGRRRAPETPRIVLSIRMCAVRNASAQYLCHPFVAGPLDPRRVTRSSRILIGRVAAGYRNVWRSLEGQNKPVQVVLCVTSVERNLLEEGGAAGPRDGFHALTHPVVAPTNVSV
jgi:hypothetical protein